MQEIHSENNKVKFEFNTFAFFVITKNIQCNTFPGYPFYDDRCHTPHPSLFISSTHSKPLNGLLG